LDDFNTLDWNWPGTVHGKSRFPCVFVSVLWLHDTWLTVISTAQGKHATCQGIFSPSFIPGIDHGSCTMLYLLLAGFQSSLCQVRDCHFSTVVPQSSSINFNDSSAFAVSTNMNILGGYLWVFIMIVICLGGCSLSRHIVKAEDRQ